MTPLTNEASTLQSTPGQARGCDGGKGALIGASPAS